MDGIALARVLGSFAHRPQVVFVTAYDEHAVDAFELQRGRLRHEAGPGRPAWPRRSPAGLCPAAGRRRPTPTRAIAVELAGVTRFVRRSQVRFVEAQGDYARLHTAEREPPGAHARSPPWSSAGPTSCGSTAARWSSLAHVARNSAWTTATARCASATSNCVVSRRHARELRDSARPAPWPAGMSERVRITHPRTDGRPLGAGPPADPRDRRAHDRSASCTSTRCCAASGGRRSACAPRRSAPAARRRRGGRRVRRVAAGSRCSGSSCRGSWSASLVYPAARRHRRASPSAWPNATSGPSPS